MLSSFLTIRLPRVVIFIWRHLHGRTCALLNSVHKFIETQGWLLLRFLICSHNQLSSFNPIIVQMTMVHFQCQHLLNKLIHLPSLWFMVLGKLPPEENCPPDPNSNTNPKPNPNTNRGAIFLRGNFPDTVIYG